jgi:hypothetical protein
MDINIRNSGDNMNIFDDNYFEANESISEKIKEHRQQREEKLKHEKLYSEWRYETAYKPEIAKLISDYHEIQDMADDEMNDRKISRLDRQCRDIAMKAGDIVMRKYKPDYISNEEVYRFINWAFSR